ncbi:hypothetical protein [Nostoc sp. NMS2]|uniref:type II toxin-antitoxin system VapC family toxin n=1 Tax=Nostoc sp. NMS2 TaxID=2815389 RepID=UPI0025E0B7AD|nr:hypothetical protein [Nostoc sp. NMS2]
MPYLVDTNVLLRSVDPSHPMNPDAVNAIRTLRDRGEQLHIVPQNLIEFWNCRQHAQTGEMALYHVHVLKCCKTPYLS